MASMPIEPPADDRAKRMVADPHGYFADARQRAEAVVTRPTSGRNRRKPYQRPAPGVVQLSVRGAREADVEWLLTELRAQGFKVWPHGQKTTEQSGGLFCRYLTVEVPEADA